MASGEDFRELRDVLAALSGRRLGIAILGNAFVYSHAAGENMARHLTSTTARLVQYAPGDTNDSYKVWAPQNDDGSFNYMPGYDGPISGAP